MLNFLFDPHFVGGVLTGIVVSELLHIRHTNRLYNIIHKESNRPIQVNIEQKTKKDPADWWKDDSEDL